MMLKNSRLSAKFEVVRDCPVLRLSGTLDAHTSTSFKHDAEELFATGYKGLVLDLKNLEFMDSSGIGALIYIFRSLKDQGGHDLWIAGCNEQVRSLLQVTQLDKQFRCFETVPNALDAWRMSQTH